VYQSTQPDIPFQLEVLISPCVTKVENESLSRIPEANEIKDVVWNMHPLKAPRPDGFSGIFFKKYWSIVGDQVVATVQSFFQSCVALEECQSYLHNANS
jgi:hypothetical protein